MLKLEEGQECLKWQHLSTQAAPTVWSLSTHRPQALDKLGESRKPDGKTGQGGAVTPHGELKLRLQKTVWLWGSLSPGGICCPASVSAPQRIKYKPLLPPLPLMVTAGPPLHLCFCSPTHPHTHPSIPLEPSRVPVSRPWSVQLALVV